MGKKKKITAVLLCLAMMLSLLPSGMAEETEQNTDEIVASFSEIDDTENGEAINKNEYTAETQEVSVEIAPTDENADSIPEIDEFSEKEDVIHEFDEIIENEEEFPPETHLWGEIEAAENGITLFETTAEDFAWELSDDGTLTISGNGDMPNWNGSNVSDISTPWYSQRSSIKSVVIEDGITSIGNCAFAWCPNLTSVTLPDSITSLGHHAFVQCRKLTDITLPSGVTKMGHNAFAACFVLEKLTIPENVTKINHRAFYQCYKLESITIPEKVTAIDGEAFYECNKLKEITIPKNVVSMGDSVFYGCDELTSVVIPDSVTSIGSRAFFYCTGLTSVTIPASVTSIGSYAFNGCSSDLFMYVYPGSYAEEYAISNNINYEFVKGNNIKLTVYDGDNNAITSGYTVNWYEKGSDTATATGNTLYGADEEKEYEYEIILGEELSKVYYQPERQSISENDVSCVLEKIPAITVNGTVTDISENTLSGIKIKFTQTVNGYVNEISAETAANGAFSAEILNIETTMKISADKYYSVTKTIIADTYDGTELDLNKQVLTELPSNKITLSLSMIKSAAAGEEASATTIGNADNLKFSLYNKTKNKQITDFAVQYPYIIINSGVNAFDVTEILVSDEKNTMTSSSVTVTLDKNRMAEAEIKFIENGKLSAKLS